MRKKIVAANWKMNGCSRELIDLSEKIKKGLVNSDKAGEVIIFPSSIYLNAVNKIFEDSGILMGAQNYYPKESGAYTGEISSLMLKDMNCKYVLVGHSERREVFKEDEKFIAQKFHHAKEHDIIPILCVGETLSQREKGVTEDIIKAQIHSVLKDDKHAFRHGILAYEPVWAIGTGKTASPEQAQEVHCFIRNLIAEVDEEAALSLSILYGGSVKANNASTLFRMPDIDGGLVGGASLNSEEFVEIVKCIN